MGDTTAIEWADHTQNFWIGCTKVSPGCHNCYAESLSDRWHWDVWGPDAPRRRTKDDNWRKPLRWNKEAQAKGKRETVFAQSLSDFFEDHPGLDQMRADAYPIIETTTWLDWLILTKRTENIPRMLPEHWLRRMPPNVWLMFSAENQEQAELRAVWMIKVRDLVSPTVIGISAEPLLGPIDFTHLRPIEPERVARLLRATHDADEAVRLAGEWTRLRYLYEQRYGNQKGVINLLDKRPGSNGIADWIIVGGESGLHHRPFNPDWARQIRDDCQANGVAYFFKQYGGITAKSGGDLLDGQQYHEFPQVAA